MMHQQKTDDDREVLAKSLVATCNIPAGTEITEAMVGIQSPGQGLQPNRLDNLIGKTLPINKDAGDFFFPSDLETPAATPRAYRFHHRFGLPVRYHDIESFAANSNLDLVEIHLSYKDLEVNLDQVLPTQQPIGLVVHAPELFAGDHTLDLCSADNDYRRHSIEELQRVVDISRDLRRRFDCPEPVLLVTNVGGFSEHHHLERPELQPLRQRLIESLQQIKTSDEVEIIPQTMPPFPWHFGGQRYHNLLSTPTSSRSSARKQGCASAWMPPTPSSPAPTSTPHSVRSSRPSFPSRRTCIWPTPKVWTAKAFRSTTVKSTGCSFLP